MEGDCIIMVEVINNNNGTNLINEDELYSLLANILIEIEAEEE